jgi:hypothetical protein
VLIARTEERIALAAGHEKKDGTRALEIEALTAAVSVGEGGAP